MQRYLLIIAAMGAAYAQGPSTAESCRSAYVQILASRNKSDMAATAEGGQRFLNAGCGQFFPAQEKAVREFLSWYAQNGQKQAGAPAQAAAPAGPVVIPKGQEFQSSRQCVPGTAVRIAGGPGAPNGGTGKVIGPDGISQMFCQVAFDGGGTSNVIYWRLANADASVKPVEPVKLPPGSEFRNSNECTAGRAVTVAANLPYDDGGPGLIVRRKDETMCVVRMTATGKVQENVIYWRMAAQGAVARYPERVAPGKYGCVTFVGRVEVRPLFDVHVTGEGTYVGADCVRGSFAYDKTRGEVRFRGGVHDGRVSPFKDNGGKGMFVFQGENGSIDCGL